MSDNYSIGRDVGSLVHKVAQLEQRIAYLEEVVFKPISEESVETKSKR